MRVIRGGDDAKTDRFVGEHLVERARHANIRIALLGVGGVALEDTCQFHTFDTTNDRSMKRLPRKTEPDKSYSYHDDFPVAGEMLLRIGLAIFQASHELESRPDFGYGAYLDIDEPGG